MDRPCACHSAPNQGTSMRGVLKVVRRHRPDRWHCVPDYSRGQGRCGAANRKPLPIPRGSAGQHLEHSSQDIDTDDQLMLGDREYVQHNQPRQQRATCSVYDEELVGERPFHERSVNLD